MEEAEDRQEPTELEKEIFGDSDSTVSDSPEAMEDVEQEESKSSEEEEEDELESEASEDDESSKKKSSSSRSAYFAMLYLLM